MKRFFKYVTGIVLCMTCLLSMAGIASAVTAGCAVFNIEGTRLGSDEIEFLNTLNDQRAKEGMEKLQLDADLQKVARLRAFELAVQWAHARPAVGYNGIEFIHAKRNHENIAMGHIGKGLFDAWYNSTDGHKQAMMDSGSEKLKSCGIATVQIQGHGVYSVLLTGCLSAEGTVSLKSGNYTDNCDVEIPISKIGPDKDYWFMRSSCTNSIEYGDPLDKYGICIGYTSTKPNGLLSGRNISFQSSNTSIFTVDAQGVIYPRKAGSADVIIKTQYGTWNYGVTVSPQEYVFKAIDSDGQERTWTCTLPKTSYDYTGSQIKPFPTVYDRFGTRLYEDIDYTITYGANVEPGYQTGTVVLNFIGNYTGKKTLRFDIKAKPEPETGDSSGGTGSGSSGSGGSGGVTVTTTPIEGGTGGSGSTGGSTPATGSQNNKFKGTLSITINSTFTYTGKPITPSVIVKSSEGEILEPSNFTVSYSNNINPGTATVSIKGLGYFSECSGKTTFKIVSNSSAKAFSVKAANVTYNGKAQKPKIVVKVDGKTISSKYYSVSYKNNKNAGIGTVTVKGKGSYAKYTGAASFKVLPRKVDTPKITAGKKTLNISWKKSASVTGYQVQLSTSKKFTGAKTFAVKSASAGIKNLKAKKNYYVRVRGFKKSGNTYVYGSWSKTVAKKTK